MHTNNNMIILTLRFTAPETCLALGCEEILSHGIRNRSASDEVVVSLALKGGYTCKEPPRCALLEAEAGSWSPRHWHWAERMARSSCKND